MDSAASFVAQTDVAGTNGKFNIDAAGNWSYAANSAFDGLNVGDSVADTFEVQSADGTKTSVKVTINGTNDVAVLSSAIVALSETNAALTTGGQLTISDVDSAASFVAQTDVAGTSGKFNIDAAGNWSYAANSAFDGLNVGQSVSDIFTVKSADGTATTVQVMINGTNDAAVLSSAVVALSETNAALTTGGQLTISDVDSAASFVAQTDVAGTNGKFNIDAAGNWSYTANSAFDGLNDGQSVSDTFAVKSADGTLTPVKVTINGTNDAANITGTASGSLTEDGAAQTTGGTLAVADLDAGQDTFAAVNAAALQGTYGSFTFDAGNGSWGYTLNNGSSAVQTLNAGQVVQDKVTVSSQDGTATRDIVVSINGANEAPTVLGYTLPTVPTTTNTVNAPNPGNVNDTLTGTAANDLINGQNGDDILSGGSGNDVINGGPGADQLTGGLGFDYLNGGNQNDIFYYTNANEATDVITGFSVGNDKLNFSGAITGGGANFALILVDTNADNAADATLLRVDSNGAAAGGTLTDMVVLVGVTNLTASDITWTA